MLDKETTYAVLAGTLGEGVTVEFMSFLTLLRTLPSIDEILLNPQHAPVPDDPSARIAVATGLGRVITGHSIGNGLTYLQRLPDEFVVLAMRDAADARSRHHSHARVHWLRHQVRRNARMSAIAEKAMLVAVHISIWTARKHDRAVSKEVAVTHNSEEKLGRFNKRLLAEGTKLEAIQTLAGKIRNYFYQNTLPWSDEGLRILPADLYFDLTSKMRDFEQEFHSAVDDFLVEYPEYVRSTRPLLNGLFREEDYPDADKLREKFKSSWRFCPSPAARTSASS